MWILVVEGDNQTCEHLVIGRVIEKATALCMRIEWPTCRVYDKTFLVQRRIDFPNFLDTNSVVLRIRVSSQIKFVHELFAEIAAYALCKNCIFAE